MYIRWKRKPRDPQWGYDEAGRWRRAQRYKTTLHIAYLVESKRVNGQPRQTARYLASINSRFLADPTQHDFFWRRIDAALEPLQLTGKQRQAADQKLLTVVPRPPEEETASSRKKLEGELRAITRRLQIRV